MAAIALGAPGAAQAAVTFDRAYGVGVDTGAAAFENCTTASTCQAGAASGAAGGMNEPLGVAVDAHGRILVVDNFNHRINRFVVAADGTVGFDRAFGIDVDPSDGDTGDFENCTSVGGCKAGTASGAAGGMNFPRGVAVDAQGRILVADTDNERVTRFAVAGDGTVGFDRAFGIDVDPSDGNTGDFENCTAAGGCQSGTASVAAGGMNFPYGVAVDAHGRIHVTDSSNHRVGRFAVASDGTVSFDRAFGIGVDTGAAVFENCTTASGCQAGIQSEAAGGLNNPQAIAVDAQGRVLVGEDDVRRVDRFAVAGDGTVSFDRGFGIDVDPTDGDTGDFENCTAASGCQTGTQSSAAGGIDDPEGVVVDAQGRILVGDSDNDRVARFAVAGDGTVSFDRAFGTDVDPGDGDTGDFENCTAASGCQTGTLNGAAGDVGPFGVAVDTHGRILVADDGNRRVDRYSPGPTVTVTNALAPATDPGTFDLRVDAVVVRAAASNGQSGSLQVADGVDATISEQAVNGRLSDYTTKIDCGGGPRTGTSMTITNVTANVECTIANTRKAPAPPPGGPGTGPTIDTSAPVFASASLTNTTFAVDPRGVAETPVSARAKRGTVFRYTLSEDARVAFTIKRATAGRRLGGRCRRQKRSNRTRPRCTRYVRARAASPSGRRRARTGTVSRA